MPLALEPNATYRVILESDQDKAKPPYFEFRYLSGREWKELSRKAEQLEAATTGAEAIDNTYDILKIGLVGWGNMVDPGSGREIPFKPNEIDALLTINETHELLEKFRNQAIDAEDKKKLDSQSASGMGRYVRRVPARKRAKKNQTKSKR